VSKKNEFNSDDASGKCVMIRVRHDGLRRSRIWRAEEKSRCDALDHSCKLISILFALSKRTNHVIN
jgi:hypothetical protein